MAAYPSATKSFTTKVDGAPNIIYAAHVNDLQDEVVALENDLRGILPISRGGLGPYGVSGTILVGGSPPAWTANPTISGSLQVTGGLGTTPLNATNLTTGTIPNARLPADVLVAGSVTAPTINASDSVAPIVAFSEMSQGANAKNFRIVGNSQQLFFQSCDDAGNPLATPFRLGRAADAAIGASLAIGTNPAQSGAVRLANGAAINFRNAANTADKQAVICGGDDNLYVGTSAIPLTDATHLLGTSGNRWSYGFYSGAVAVGTNPAQSGAVRLANNEAIVARNAANTADVTVAVIDNINNLVLGSTTGGSAYVRGGSGAIIQGASGVQYDCDAAGIYPSPDNSRVIGHPNLRFKSANLYAVNLKETAAPAVPAADCANLWIEDNGAGKSQLMIQYDTGLAKEFATYPLDGTKVGAGSVPDTALSSNVALKNVANVFTGLNALGAATQYITGLAARVILNDTTQVADSRKFQIALNGTTLYLGGTNDAETVGTAPVSIDRGGNLVAGPTIRALGESPTLSLKEGSSATEFNLTHSAGYLRFITTAYGQVAYMDVAGNFSLANGSLTVVGSCRAAGYFEYNRGARSGDWTAYTTSVVAAAGTMSGTLSAGYSFHGNTCEVEATMEAGNCDAAAGYVKFALPQPKAGLGTISIGTVHFYFAALGYETGACYVALTDPWYVYVFRPQANAFPANWAGGYTIRLSISYPIA